MPNTGKSHHQPHAYPAAREKLQSQQPTLPPPAAAAAARAAATTHFVPDAPLSARPFMTMVAPAPFAALQPPPAASHHHHPQYQHPLHAPSPLQPHFHGYNSYPPPAAHGNQTHNSATAAFGAFARLQPTPTVAVVARSSSPRTAWREEIEQRTRVMERSSAPAFAGVKRPAPHPSVSSPRNGTSPYNPERVAARSYAPPSPRAFAPPLPPQGTSALPTLSCVLQRNADASLSTPSSSLHNGDSELSHHHYVSHKRQRVFVPPAQEERRRQQEQERDDRQHQQHHREQLEYEQQYRPAAGATTRGPVTTSMASLYGRSDLTGVDNDHLRSILEKEIAVYNQRPTHTRQVPAALASSLYEAPSAKYTRSSSIYSHDERHPGSYADDVAGSPRYHRDAAASPPPSHHDQHPHRDSASRVYPSYGSSTYTSANHSSSSASSRLPSDTHADYSRAMMSTDSQQQQPERPMHRDSSVLPPSRSYGNRMDATSLRSPPQTQQTPQHRHHYTMNGMPSQSGYDSPVPASRRDGPSASVTGSSAGRAAGVRTTTTTSGYRGFVRSADDDPQHLSGEAVIEAASGLVEERSPSKRESITKLLLKSKEFLKAKSLVRNRNNEIDWVATFLNVGFEASSIYSLMCPLRKGRWKVEEEKYAMELLRLVESGTVRLRHGQSIRGFVAKKLHSDDMRVLKKLSNCKMFHFARAITPRMSEEEEIDESVPGAAEALGRLETLRSEFLRSVQLEALVAVRKYLSDSSIRELLNGRD